MATKKDTGVYVRNLRSVPVHIRLSSLTSEKPFRVNLNRRGLQGDCQRVPVALKDSPEYAASHSAGLFEEIPASEAASIEYPPVGYQGMQTQIDADWAKPITVVRNEEQVIARIDESGKQVRTEMIGPRLVHVPGADHAVTERVNPSINQPNATQAREIAIPDKTPQDFASPTLSPQGRESQTTQGRRPPNRNPRPQKAQGA